jgi:hypothetical protein
MSRELSRRLLAEFLGSAFLAALVIGSGIAAQQLSPNDTGLALLENATATAAGLLAIILMFGPSPAGTSTPSSRSSTRTSGDAADVVVPHTDTTATTAGQPARATR